MFNDKTRRRRFAMLMQSKKERDGEWGEIATWWQKAGRQES
jgi:hypothetical protein